MNCNRCGHLLTGQERVCPNCGTIVEANINNQAMDMGIQNNIDQSMMPNNLENQVVQDVSQINTMNPIQQTPQENIMSVPTALQPAVPPVQEASRTSNVNPGIIKDNSNKVLIIIVSILIVALLGVILFFVVFAKNETTIPQNNTKEEVVETEEEKEVTGSIVYGGYTLTLPDGYFAKILEDGLLFIHSEQFGIVLGVDYSNNYYVYADKFTTQYPDLMASALQTIQNIGANSYLILAKTDSAGLKVFQYLTVSENMPMFTGALFNANGAPITGEDLAVLDNIIITKQATGGTVSVDSDDNVGKNGPVDVGVEVLNYLK